MRPVDADELIKTFEKECRHESLRCPHAIKVWSRSDAYIRCNLLDLAPTLKNFEKI